VISSNPPITEISMAQSGEPNRKNRKSEINTKNINLFTEDPLNSRIYGWEKKSILHPASPGKIFTFTATIGNKSKV
ncbi:MAG: hypothetical protein WBK71_02610, partial [Acetomicrobium sp.]